MSLPTHRDEREGDDFTLCSGITNGLSGSITIHSLILQTSKWCGAFWNDDTQPRSRIRTLWLLTGPKMDKPVRWNRWAGRTVFWKASTRTPTLDHSFKFGGNHTNSNKRKIITDDRKNRFSIPSFLLWTRNHARWGKSSIHVQKNPSRFLCKTSSFTRFAFFDVTPTIGVATYFKRNRTSSTVQRRSKNKKNYILSLEKRASWQTVFQILDCFGKRIFVRNSTVHGHFHWNLRSIWQYRALKNAFSPRLSMVSLQASSISTYRQKTLCIRPVLTV